MILQIFISPLTHAFTSIVHIYINTYKHILDNHTYKCCFFFLKEKSFKFQWCPFHYICNAKRNSTAVLTIQYTGSIVKSKSSLLTVKLFFNTCYENEIYTYIRDKVRATKCALCAYKQKIALSAHPFSYFWRVIIETLKISGTTTLYIIHILQYMPFHTFGFRSVFSQGNLPVWYTNIHIDILYMNVCMYVCLYRVRDTYM